MSHLAKVKTKLNNKQYLLKGLETMGFTYQVAEEGQVLQTQGQYNQVAEADILITGVKGNTNSGYGSYKQDVGFKLQADGTYTAVGDPYNLKDKNGSRVSMDKLKCNVTAYSKEAEVNERLQQFMFSMDESTREETSKELSFTLQRWVA